MPNAAAFLAEDPPVLGPADLKWLASAVVVIGAGLWILYMIRELRKPGFVAEPDFKKFEEYVHNKNHDLLGQIQHLEAAAEERRIEAAEQNAAVIQLLTAMGDKLDGKRSASVGNLHEQLKQAEVKLAHVTQEAATHTQQLAQIDAKFTLILQRLPRSLE